MVLDGEDEGESGHDYRICRMKQRDKRRAAARHDRPTLHQHFSLTFFPFSSVIPSRETVTRVPSKRHRLNDQSFS